MFWEVQGKHYMFPMFTWIHLAWLCVKTAGISILCTLGVWSVLTAKQILFGRTRTSLLSNIWLASRVVIGDESWKHLQTFPCTTHTYTHCPDTLSLTPRRAGPRSPSARLLWDEYLSEAYPKLFISSIFVIMMSLIQCSREDANLRMKRNWSTLINQVRCFYRYRY